MSTENQNTLSPTQQYEKDKQSVENFLNSDPTKEKKTFDVAEFKRLVLNELTFNKFWDDNKYHCLGFSRCQIEEMAEHPERFGVKILKLSNYMYLKSGYYKRLIDYFVNQALLNYTVDTSIKTQRFLTTNPETIQKNYIRYIADIERFGLKNEIQNILKRMYKNDVCYAYMIEDESGIHYFYLDPFICGLHRLVQGNVYQFYIKVRAINDEWLDSFPLELQEFIRTNYDKKTGRVIIPVNKGLCFKYNNDIPFPYPPFIMMIADILLIDEYKDLAKAQSINDAYKLLTMKIPTKDGEISLDQGLIKTFTSIVLSVVDSHIGVITTPFDMDTEEFSSSNSDDRDTVSDAISWAFKNVGVSESLMSGASSGSELKLSITNDSADIFRIYRMIESWMSLQMKLRGHFYNDYDFVYQIINTTVFNIDDTKKTELQMAQNGLPTKTRLCAVNGLSPATMIGNTIVENQIFGDLFSSWVPLKTSYTATGDDSTSGRPMSEDGDLSASGENTRGNDSNNPDNRI